MTKRDVDIDAQNVLTFWVVAFSFEIFEYLFWWLAWFKTYVWFRFIVFFMLTTGTNKLHKAYKKIKKIYAGQTVP